MALSATTLAAAQTAPPANTQSTEPSANSSGNTTSEPAAASPAPADKMSAQDPKMKECLKAEKAKNSGLSDNQLKQKCMLQIGSHQGQ